VNRTPGQNPAGATSTLGNVVGNRDPEPARHQRQESVGWEPGCGCSAGAEYLADDLDVIGTPTGERAGLDPTMQTGRRGMNRPRGKNEGRRPITRYEQRRYAEQLRMTDPARTPDVPASWQATQQSPPDPAVTLARPPAYPQPPDADPPSIPARAEPWVCGNPRPADAGEG
jgi:hypothetical protein